MIEAATVHTDRDGNICSIPKKQVRHVTTVALTCMNSLAAALRNIRKPVTCDLIRVGL